MQSNPMKSIVVCYSSDIYHKVEVAGMQMPIKHLAAGLTQTSPLLFMA